MKLSLFRVYDQIHDREIVKTLCCLAFPFTLFMEGVWRLADRYSSYSEGLVLLEASLPVGFTAVSSLVVALCLLHS
jgi:hypothetical protein